MWPTTSESPTESPTDPPPGSPPESPSAAARHSTFVEQARRRQLVAAAIEVLARDGFAGASLAAIARHVGVAKGVISYHFAGKGDLLRAVVATVLADATEHMTARIGAAADPLAALRAYVLANLDYLDGHRVEIAALTEVLNNLRAGEGEPAPYAAAGRSAVAGVIDLLVAGQRAGQLRPFSARVVAISLRAAIDAVPALLRVEPDLDVPGYAVELADLLERAVRA